MKGCIYVPYIKGSTLKKLMQEAEDKMLDRKLTGRIRILKRLGRTQTSSNPTPWRGEHYGRSTCPACQHKPEICKARNAVYGITCGECQQDGTKSMYIGETARTIWYRTSEHFQKMESRNKDNPLYKHWKNFHPEKEAPPKYTVSKLLFFSSDHVCHLSILGLWYR